MVLRLKTRESRSPPDLIRTPSLNTLHTAGWSSPVARQAHNLKAAGSNPAPATRNTRFIKLLIAALRGGVCVSTARGSTVEARGAEVLHVAAKILAVFCRRYNIMSQRFADSGETATEAAAQINCKAPPV